MQDVGQARGARKKKKQIQNDEKTRNRTKMDYTSAKTYPLEFSDNIYHGGNFSKMPDFDVFYL